MKTLLFSLLITSAAWGQVSKVDIQNFNFSYQAPLGEGTADSFSYSQKNQESQKVLVEKFGEDFKIVLEGVENQELTFKDAPALIKDAEKIELKNFNLSFAEKFSLSIASGLFHSQDDELDLTNLKLNCDRASGTPEVMDQVIAGCFQNMSFKAGGFSSESLSLTKALIDSIDTAVGVKNLDFKIAGGKFTLEADVKAQVSGRVKSLGTAKYDIPTKKMTLKISEVKFGFLDITSKVFEELEKQETDNLKVSKPYVYITIK